MAESTAEFTLSVLGPCAVIASPPSTDAGAPNIELSAIQNLILVRLALASPGTVGIDELIDAVWRDKVPATAKTSLHNQISRIRNRLGQEAILTSGGKYALGLRTDVELISRLLERADQAMEASDMALVSEIAKEALALWRGTPFEELDADDEADLERRRLFEVKRVMETLRLESAVSAGRLTWAVPEAERLVNETPTDEHRWVLLIRALEAAGRRGDALGAFERARRSLAERLGLEPSEALRSAELSVLGSGDAERVGTVHSFIGRSSLLESAIRDLAEHKAILLTGEPGVGRSRVLQELRRRLRQQGYTVASSDCPLHSGTAVETLRELAEGLGVTFDPELAPVASFEAVLARAVHARGKIALTIDDLDRAGPTTIDALSSAVNTKGVVLVATGDDSILETEPWLTPVVVGPLSSGELAQLAKELVGGDGIEPSSLKWLIEMSGGNPTFLEYLVSDMGRAAGTNRRGGTIEDPIEGTRGLQDMVRLRLDRLGIRTRQALDAASVCGLQFPVSVISQLATDEGIAGARAASLLVPYQREDGTEGLRFRHAVVRGILYDDLPPGRRLEMHHRIASLIRSTTVPVSVVASHSVASAELDPQQAAVDAIAAAGVAADEGAYQDSARWFQAALDVLSNCEACDRLTVVAKVGYGDSLRCAGSPDQQVAMFDAADAAFELGDAELIGSAVFALLQLGATTEPGPIHDKAMVLAARALEEITDPDQRALIAGGASLANSMTDNSALSREYFLQAESQAISPEVRRNILPFTYLGLGHPADLDTRGRLTDELLELSSTADDPNARFEALQLSFSMGLLRCDGARVRKAVADARSLLPKVGDVGRRWSLKYQMAAVAHLDNELDVSEALAAEALEIFGGVSPSRAFAAYGAQILAIRMAQGRLDELRETVEAFAADQPGVPAWNAALALVLAEDDPDRAAACARAALDNVINDFTWLGAHLVGGRAAAAVGDPEICAAFIERLAPYTGLGSWQGTCSYGPVDTVLWKLNQAIGDDEATEFHLNSARRAAQNLMAPVFLAELD